MKNEQHTNYSRHVWDADLINAQEELNQSVAALVPEIEQYERELTDLHTSNSERYDTARNQAITMLDKKWKHHNDTLIAVGKYFIPKPLHELFDSSTGEFTYAETVQTGENYGFSTAYDEEREKIRLGLYMEIGCVAIKSASYQLEGDAYAVVPFDSASLTMAVPHEKANAVSANSERAVALLGSAASQYHKHILDPNSTFYAQPDAERQHSIIEAISSIPNREMPNAMSQDSLHFKGKFPHLYVFDTPTQTLLKVPSKSKKLLEIEGKVCGFTTLDCLGEATPRALHSPQDLIEPEAGIVAGVDVTSSNGKLETDKHLFYAPIRLGIDLGMNIFRT